ncbi:MAG TPA: metallophosphoesterase [Polyangiales bacterium]|nr:metallophosphoesterase [Polyangiales bacterium]
MNTRSSAPLFRFASAGRGSQYPWYRGLVESLAQLLYRGDWPAKLWALYPRACQVTCLRQQLAILPPSAASLRVGFISDLHIGPTTPPALLDAAFELLAREALDVLLLGGDYVFLDADEAKAERLAALIRRVPAARKIAVLGNHDLWTDHGVLEAALRRAEVELLNNQSTRLPGDIAVIGLDEPWTGTLDASAAVRDIGSPRALIVLCHSPDGLPEALRTVSALPGSPPGLYVCGHTHGGQIAAPWGPIVVPSKVGRTYPFGLHQIPPLHLHVSRGVGASELPMRSWAPPEVAVFELVAQRDA